KSPAHPDSSSSSGEDHDAQGLVLVSEKPTDKGCLGRAVRKRKGKKGGKRPPTTRAARPRHPGLTPHFHHGGGGRWTILGGPPEYGPGSDSAQSYRPQPDSEGWYAESYDHYMEIQEGYVDYGEYGECSDVSLRSDVGFGYGEDPSMEVEELLYGDPSNGSDVESVDSESNEAPALQIPPKALPGRRRSSGTKRGDRARGHSSHYGVQPRNTHTGT
ncbi:hypothetical protein P4O66_014169, partial [Electrophorus voltai]